MPASAAAPASSPPGQKLQQLALHEAYVGRLVGTTYTPGPGTELLPTVVLLHGEGDDPAAARSVLPPSRPLRVVTLLGRLTDNDGRRRYIDPLLQAAGLGWPLVVDQGDVDVIGASPDAATVRAWLATRWTEGGLS